MADLFPGTDPYGMTGPGPDLFGTEALRRDVLAAWSASPARFREDANAEEELVLGGYRDRLVVELAQNAADAAVRAGLPGRLRLTLRGGVLAAANTGVPLDAAGVAALSTLRASAKRDMPSATVGRFGVGFASVLAVTDSPAVISHHGGVRWSRQEALALMDKAGAVLADELLHRNGVVPVLRLPFPAEGTPPQGYDTVVVLPLRDASADALVRRLLADVDDALLLTLPALREVVVDIDGTIRTLTCHRDGAVVRVNTDAGAETRWHVVHAEGTVPAGLLADRPVEERARPVWSVTWAVPLTGPGTSALTGRRGMGHDASGRNGTAGQGIARVVHAPTPTDEPLGLPALLIASFPLDVTRRHVAPGPLRDFLVQQAAAVYADLLHEWPVRPVPADVLDLVPGPDAAGELDAVLRRAILPRIAETPFLPAAADPGLQIRPRDAVAVEAADDALVAVLAPVLAGLLPADFSRHRTALAAAGARLASLAEVIDSLAGLDCSPKWWRDLYAALARTLPGADRDALGALPVPLADGRTVRGPRGLLLPAEGLDASVSLSALGLRLVHSDAAHPLLERLGALPATPRAVLADPAVRAAVADSYDADDPEAVAEAVLELVRAARPVPGELPWLAELALPDAEGELAPAGELMLPDSPIAGVVEPGALGVVDAALAGRWEPEVLEAVGVLRTFALVREHDVPLDPDMLDTGVDGEQDWCEQVLAALPSGDVPPMLAEYVAVRDLDLVADDAWPRVLEMLAAPPLREALVAPARVLLPDGGVADVTSATAWWLREHPVLDGRRPVELRAPGADELLEDLYDEARTGLDPALLRALGVRTTLDGLLAEPASQGRLGGPDELLARLADPAREVSRAALRRLYTALAGVDPERVTPPDRLRALVDGRPQVVDAGDVVVVDAPDLLPLVAGRPVVMVPADLASALADLLALPLAEELLGADVLTSGEVRPVPGVVLELLPGAPETYVEHESLEVAIDSRAGVPAAQHADAAFAVHAEIAERAELDWRYVDGTVHAATVEGLARGLAWAADAWERRFEVLTLLLEPERAAELCAERDFDDR